ncbi:alpha-D-glucose phosphate-specific phosphoglucomutase [Hellea sp.]|nr:alpha-D-glucose phosphate-specific phosphoglucomutase [Hellea sp.]MDC1088733.1 alpha-D-glucose phosphate-specific phosphoglucomutase [Hellea sp.]
MDTIQTTYFDDQKPGTSGLRKKTKVFTKKNYLENYVQCLFNSIPELIGGTLVLGGDGRYFNKEAIQKIVGMASANGVSKVILGCDGLLSTPAVSCIIRKYKADAGIILSASHNPGGIEGDFGIKLNGSNGGPVSEQITNKIYEQTKLIKNYKIVQDVHINLNILGLFDFMGMTIEIIDSVNDYANLMNSIFDFNAIKALFSTEFTFCFDAMNAVTGPYANEIFINRLGAPATSIINSTPKEDFGGLHPDPNHRNAGEIFSMMFDGDNVDFAACSDGDGDRSIVLGKKTFVSPSDSLALLTANATLIKKYKDGILGVARSVPTSKAVDLVAKKLNIKCYETPTGWKFFGNLIDNQLITFCGEESAGAGSNHIREKDGIWAVLMWLNIIAVTKLNIPQLINKHWKEFGRHYYSRHDYEEIEESKAIYIFRAIEEKLSTLRGFVFGDETVSSAEIFTYKDPVDKSISENQGIVIELEGSSRIVIRLSGTGTAGATLRIYFEKYVTPEENLYQDTQMVLSNLINIANEITQIKDLLGKDFRKVIS